MVGVREGKGIAVGSAVGGALQAANQNKATHKSMKMLYFMLIFQPRGSTCMPILSQSL